MSFQFRPLNREDAAQILHLAAEMEKQQGLPPDFYWPQKDLEEEIWITEGWGAFKGSELVAFALYREKMDVWEITVLATSPQERRRRVMSQLLQRIIDAMNQVTEIWLEVHERNDAAQKLYEKLGFTQVGTRPRYYRDGGAAFMYSHFG